LNKTGYNKKIMPMPCFAAAQGFISGVVQHGVETSTNILIIKY